ncbi:hypothetical protein P43SY_002269 [Pythium insidiosum]|uniref:GST C-terminal domain-containing protein n=1 Tax=Pythium insidiosum TaxID=114742 RepID=A0AAD5Q411_PYTIN|nr:hypothetical protein P43SY_002269 [Pythium insidiosum]
MPIHNDISTAPGATYAPEKGRYQLYVGLGCPFACRVLSAIQVKGLQDMLYVGLGCPFACRVLSAIQVKGLQDMVDVTIVHPVFQRTRPDDAEDTHTGWAIVDPKATPFLAGPTGIGQYSSEGCSPDPVHGAKFVRDLYERALGPNPGVRFSVPLLWDKKTNTIVSTESADILRNFNSAFESLRPSSVDLYPEALRAQIDETNEWVADAINNGVYKAGFAQSQSVFDEAIVKLYAALDRVEAILSKQRFLIGKAFTEADIRLFVTLIRFDEVYAVMYKTNKKLIRDYPNISNYLKDVYQVPGMKATVNFRHIRESYFASNPTLNPFSIVPTGVDFDYASPHDRARFQ